MSSRASNLLVRQIFNKMLPIEKNSTPSGGILLKFSFRGLELEGGLGLTFCDFEKISKIFASIFKNIFSCPEIFFGTPVILFRQSNGTRCVGLHELNFKFLALQ